MNYELSNILFVFPYFIEISKNKILISRCCYRQSCVLNNYATATLILSFIIEPQSGQTKDYTIGMCCFSTIKACK